MEFNGILWNFMEFNDLFKRGKLKYLRLATIKMLFER